MEGIPILRDLVILVAVAVPISFIFARLGIPTIVGYLVTGVLIGPSGLGLVTDMHSVEVLAEIGVVLLLFTIGLEFSLARMAKIKREALVGGGLQVFITTVITIIVAQAFGSSLTVALLLGFVVSLSSTAIIMKMLLDKGELNSYEGNLSVGILLFQDIAIVLMVIVVHSMGEGGGIAIFAIAKGLGQAIAAIIVIVLLARYIIPKLFYHIVRLQNREVFILTIVMVCMGTAIITSLFGLSLALGAFIAGLVISESEYSEQIVSDVMPFRDTFSAVFFISIGMLLELKYFAFHLPEILALTVGVILIKAIVVAGIGRILKYPIRLSIVVGLTLAQVGEFSFILIKMGESYSILSMPLYQTMLAVSIITMAAAPFVFMVAPGFAFRVGHWFGGRELQAKPPKTTKMSNHVIIVGYGLSGQNLALVLQKTGIEHLIVDTNADRIKQAKKDGHKAHYGDSTYSEVLKNMGIERAKMIVVATHNPIATRRIVKVSRDLNSVVTIVVRTRMINEVEDLYRLGATQVIPEEFETSVEIFARVLKDYNIPSNIIQNQIDLVRGEGYAMLRHPDLSREAMVKLTNILEATVMDTFYVDEGCNMTGTTLAELDLRKRTGTTIIAIIRGGKAQTNPHGDKKIESGDILVILGSHAELHAAMELLKNECPI